jgi:hypothetical protein
MSPELTSLALMGESALWKRGAAAVAACFVLLLAGCGGLDPAKVAQSFENSRSARVGVSDELDMPYVNYCNKASYHYQGNVVYDCDVTYGGPNGTMEHTEPFTFDKVRGRWEANPVP